MSILGRLPEAQEEMHRALELDPLSLIVLADIGQLYYFARDYDQAQQYCERALALDPNFQFAHLYLWEIYRMKGMTEEALRELADAEFPGATPETLARVREEYVKGGLLKTEEDQLELFLHGDNERRKINALRIAQFYCLLGKTEQAMQALETIPQKPNFFVPYIKLDPIYDPLRGDPRFQALLQKINLS